MSNTLNELRLRGFDEAYKIPRSKSYRVKCSQCQALVINGIATHETGCPNATHECNGCSELIPARQKYCNDCQ